ncbi:hypothetical protein AAJ76_2310001308 [Vairimorpha ceranae]|uniref:Uncharacterized protein n=1 Tax=Vairimorpha ceranae TaxID=40302 RepID=A0A0F9Z793_9MICR|nr:hypothetical protein AAJ76_2310001308 [Vairimorpha ceranae]KKO73789.1 hypothetical protein AAJ76_2310001308 [Vairimorpha ceranae]
MYLAYCLAGIMLVRVKIDVQGSTRNSIHMFEMEYCVYVCYKYLEKNLNIL